MRKIITTGIARLANKMNGRLRPIFSIQLSDKSPTNIPAITSTNKAIDTIDVAENDFIPTQSVKNRTKYADIKL